MQPMLASRGDHVPSGDAWVHEVKWDGIRLLVDVRNGRLRISTRSANDATVAFPEMASIVEGLTDVVLDGEAIAMQDGRPNFAAVADRLHVSTPGRALRLSRAKPVTFIAFDLLRADGEDLTKRPLEVRQELLRGLDLGNVFADSDRAIWQVPTGHDDGLELQRIVNAQGLEGIVSKRRASLYYPGRRSRDWLKFPSRSSDSFVLGGIRFEAGTSSRIGSMLLGKPGAHGLTYWGRVGAGLAGRPGNRLTELIVPLVTGLSPFADDLPREDREETVWLRPEIVIEVEYLAKTADGRLRHPAYRGVRADLAPTDLAAD
jgi:bifunctional non-homologous end joining protein LigD